MSYFDIISLVFEVFSNDSCQNCHMSSLNQTISIPGQHKHLQDSHRQGIRALTSHSRSDVRFQRGL